MKLKNGDKSKRSLTVLPKGSLSTPICGTFISQLVQSQDGFLVNYANDVAAKTPDLAVTHKSGNDSGLENEPQTLAGSYQDQDCHVYSLKNSYGDLHDHRGCRGPGEDCSKVTVGDKSGGVCQGLESGPVTPQANGERGRQVAPRQFYVYCKLNTFVRRKGVAGYYENKGLQQACAGSIYKINVEGHLRLPYCFHFCGILCSKHNTYRLARN